MTSVLPALLISGAIPAIWSCTPSAQPLAKVLQIESEDVAVFKQTMSSSHEHMHVAVLCQIAGFGNVRFQCSLTAAFTAVVVHMR